MSANSCTALFAAAVLAVCLPLAAAIEDRALGSATLAVIVVCTVGAARASAPRARPMELLFWSFLGIWLGGGSLYQLSHGWVAWGDTSRLAGVAMDLRGQLLTLGALLAFGIGAASVRLARPIGPVAPPAVRLPHRHERPLLAAWQVPAGYLAAAVLLLPVVAATSGGLGSLFENRAERTEAFARSGALADGRTTDGFLRILPASLALAGTYVLLMLLLSRAGRLPGLPGRTGGPLLTCTLAGVALMAVYDNPLSMSRYISASAFAALAVLIWQPRSRRAGLWFACWAVVGFLLLYPLAYVLRGSTAQDGGSSSWWSVLGSNDFDGYQQVLNTLQMVDEHGHTGGSYLLSALLYVVPRAMWAAKAQPASLDVAANRGYVFTDLGLPLHAELFLDLGLLGMLLALALLGAAWARLDQRWLTRPGSIAARVVPFLGVAQIGLLRGPLGSLVPVAGTSALLVLLATALAVAGVRSVPTRSADLSHPTHPFGGTRVRDRAPR